MKTLPLTMPILSDMRITHVYGEFHGIVALDTPLALKAGDVVLQYDGLLKLYRRPDGAPAGSELLAIEERRVAPPGPPRCSHCHGTGKEP